ncbi:sporulation protein SPS19 [Lodderomyces elongisporus NRRL YB-4239]|uniref:2,4-dienoyl-CoA reductase [(3E)-enoyl-CoA-producing] n=1 Tax=Lodderomyces elongisporus (strain ATCC 11503 / CBS 2605 / JCM 1781 / NBRC 1676 / NRRL YB-4239) TaxID=379508 RepID=A5E3Q4_LODEL|nr:sporulation protein SPS19 [Lodderomyces elongisporus NRRL YB-4239]
MPNTLTDAYVKNSVWKPDIYKDKVVFVTGGAGTICRVQTEALVLLGANAAIIGRNVEKTEAAAKEIAQIRPGAKVIGLGNVDVRKVHDLKAAVDKTVAELGKIDYVIAGAAGNFLADFNHLSSNAFKTVIDIDLLGSFNTVKACFEELRKNKGAVIFVSATLHYYGIPFQSHVGAAKAGVDALMNALAVELGPIGVRLNCIAPGLIGNTEGGARLNPPTEVPLDQKVPIGRIGTTTDVADTTVYLFSPAASYITGTVTVVDGGLWQIGGFLGELYPSVVKQQLEDPEVKL